MKFNVTVAKVLEIEAEDANEALELGMKRFAVHGAITPDLHYEITPQEAP